jgi:hypothetical protein
MRLSTASAESKSGMATSVVAVAWGAGRRRSSTRVMMPSVPSAPMKNCLRS